MNGVYNEEKEEQVERENEHNGGRPCGLSRLIVALFHDEFVICF